MNDEWVKIYSLLEVDNLAERIQEIEQAKEMWKSILDNYVIEYKFEIGEHEEKKTDQFCIGKVYTLDLWVKETYYQMTKEKVDEINNAPSSNDAWELQNEIPIEDEELDETVNAFQDKEKTYEKKNTVFKIYTIMIMLLILSIFVAQAIQETNPDLAMKIPLIVFGVVVIVIVVMTIIMIIKRRK